MKKKEHRLSRAELGAFAQKSHSAVCEFLNKPGILSTLKGKFVESAELTLLKIMLKSKCPFEVKDKEVELGKDLVAKSTVSAAAKRLDDVLSSFSDQFQVLKEEEIVISIPRRKGGAQVGYFLCCLSSIDGSYLDPEDIAKYLQKAFERWEEGKEKKSLSRQSPNFLDVATEASQKAALLDIDTKVHFADLIAYHCSVFAGRSSELAQFDECIGTKNGGYIFVEGPSGFGKTALLAKLTQSIPIAAYHFISQSLSGSSDLFDPTKEDCFLAGLCRQLQEKAKKTGQINVNDLRGTYLSLLAKASDTGEPTIVIIDAVDEVDPNRNFLRGLFPRRLPKGAFVIFSARTIGDQTYLPYLGLTSADIASTVALDSFDIKGVCALLEKAGRKARSLADKREFVEELHGITEGDPFYLRFVVEDIRDGVIGPGNIADTPRGLNDYLDMQFEQLSKSATSQQQRDILGFILHAKGPLKRSALISLVHGLDSINFDTVIQGVRRFLLERNGEFTFCHERFRQYFESKVSA